MHHDTTTSPLQPGSLVTPERLEILLDIARKHGVSYLATGDVVLRLTEQHPATLTAQQGQDRPAPTLLTTDDIEAARQERLRQAELRRTQSELQRQGERPLPDPWDAWRQQKAPDMFASEVTHRG